MLPLNQLRGPSREEMTLHIVREKYQRSELKFDIKIERGELV